MPLIAIDVHQCLRDAPNLSKEEEEVFACIPNELSLKWTSDFER
jgi:hypothetical protein